MMEISFVLNGEPVAVSVDPAERLLDTLRYCLGNTGTKEGCGEGECGACTVLLDGEPVNSCIVFAAQCRGREVMTIEGIAREGELDRVQKAFIEAGAVQCGFCTPGMIVSAYALLASNPHPTRAEIEEAISGNLCRCTGYVKIVDAVSRASE